MTLASFRKVEPIEETISKLAGQGFEAVEMFGEPQHVDIPKLKDTLSTHRLTVSGITGMWGAASRHGWRRRLLSSDRDLVNNSVRYVRDCVKMCNSLGGLEMNVCLFADELPGFDRTHGTLGQNEKDRLAQRAVPILAELCRFASDHGVKLVLEPLNRYSTPHCSTAKDAFAIVKQVGSDSLGMMLDTFHMNIEEDSFEDAIRAASGLLWHTHFADNNRKMPGFGHIDFAEIVRCLKGISYDGYASFEPNIADGNYEHDVRKGLELVRQMEAGMGRAATA